MCTLKGLWESCPRAILERMALLLTLVGLWIGNAMCFLAFKQNGEWLTPDHGAPLRTLLPGCIGGRMIKWLSKMWISDKPSENHYHFFDNRVLPPHVDAEIASEEGWWYKPEYIINHININSAMFEPRHMSM